jgi:curved DNA-binding protein CbpA
VTDDRLDQLSYYDLLQIEGTAGVDAVRNAFHAFARRYHPDRFAGEPPEKQERAAQIYRRGTEAYRVLCDPAERRRYDAGLASGALRLAEPPPQRPGAAASAPQSGAIKNVKARPLAQKARELLAAGDLKGAKLHAKLALGHEPDSAALQALLSEIDDKLAR